MRRIGAAILLALVILLLQPSAWHPLVPLPLRILIVAIAAGAAWRPDIAVLAVAALVPFGHVLVTSVWSAYPFAAAEAVVLAFLAGCLVRHLAGRSLANRPFDTVECLAMLWAAAIATSFVVQVKVLQVWHDYPWEYAMSFLAYLGRDYLTTMSDPRPWVDGRTVVSAAALPIEGLALFIAARRVCESHTRLPTRLLAAIAAAGAGAAFLTPMAIVSESIATGMTITELIREGRWSFAIPSINTSGAYFMLIVFLALGAALARGRDLRAVGWWTACVVALAAMWLTKTRASIVSGLAVSAGALVWMVLFRGRSVTARAAAAAAIVAVLVGAALVFLNPLNLLASGAERSLGLRFASSETALRMMAAYPGFGVGVGQYWLRSVDFMDPEVFAVFPARDAHNYYLWIAAELGLVGFACFIGLLLAVAALLWRRLRTQSGGWLWSLATAGTAAFVVTWISGQPMNIPQVAFTFWAALAATVAMTIRTTHPEPSKVLRRVVIVAPVVLLASIPFRVQTALADVDLSRVAYGFHEWETDSQGNRVRWTKPHATFFVRSSVRAIELPLSAGRLADHRVTVDIMVNGRPADRVTLEGGGERRLRIGAPVATDGFWRVDLYSTSAVTTTSELPRPMDTRQLGVAVGAINVLVEQRD